METERDILEIVLKLYDYTTYIVDLNSEFGKFSS